MASFSGYSHVGRSSSSLVSFLHFSALTNLHRTCQYVHSGHRLPFSMYTSRGKVVSHGLASSKIELARTQETQLQACLLAQCLPLPGLVSSSCVITYQRQGVEAVGITLALERGPQLLDLLYLLGRQVARVAVLLDGSDDGEIIVVVLGVELDARGVGSGSHVDE